MLRHITAISECPDRRPRDARIAIPAAVRGCRALLAVAVAAGLGTAAGCRSLSTTSAAGIAALAADSAARPANAQTISVELSFVRYEAGDTVLQADLWNFVDEQAIDDGLRRRLARNGLRAGVITGDLPGELAARLTVPDADAALQSDARGGSRRQMRLLPGRHAEIVAAAARPEVVLLEEHDGGVRGGTFRDCSGVVALRAWPAADGRVRIEAVPELRHGSLQRSWVGEEGMFRLETGQARHRREDLGIAVSLPAQGMLVIGPANDATATVGDALLRDHTGVDVAGMQLLVVRPLAATVDPMFADAAATTTLSQDAPERP